MTYNWEISLLKRSMCFLGFWPEDDRYIHIKFIITAIFSVIAYMPTFIGLFHTKTDQEIMNNLTYTLTFAIVMFEVYNFRVKRQSMITVLKWMRENWKHYTAHYENSHAVMRRWAQSGHRMMKIIYMAMFISYIGKYESLSALSNTETLYCCRFYSATGCHWSNNKYDIEKAL